MQRQKIEMSSIGKLHLILGPMFSGKTTKLIDIYNENKEKNKKVIAVNYSADRRYHDSMLSTHDKVMIPCLFTESIAEVLQSTGIIEAEIILINEGQFFPDLYETVLMLVEQLGKTVYICGLDGDFKRNRFGELLNLLPFCDSVIKLSARCNICCEPAIFSRRITRETEQVVIGSSNYIPVCRACYHVTVEFTPESSPALGIPVEDIDAAGFDVSV